MSFTKGLPQDVAQQIAINSGRPTFYDPPVLIPGKIALEEHVSNSLFTGSYTTPFVNFTNKISYDIESYGLDVKNCIDDIELRVKDMDAANISMNIVMFGAPGIQGVFNKTFATYAAKYVNNEIYAVYKTGNHSSRFGFWCSNAL